MYEKLLAQATELKGKWLLCQNDIERINLAAESKLIRFTLDNDSTSCSFEYDVLSVTQEQSDEISDEFGLYYLDNDLGNRSGVGVLLTYFGIPWEDC